MPGYWVLKVLGIERPPDFQDTDNMVLRNEANFRSGVRCSGVQVFGMPGYWVLKVLGIEGIGY